MIPTTRDGLWSGRLILEQPARGHGYRFNLDPVLLAHFAPRAESVLDLGCGCGVIGVLLLALGKASRVIAVERRPELAALAERNAAANGFADRVVVRCGDLREVALDPVDAVVFNPPYLLMDRHRGSPDDGRDSGRRERHGTLADFVRVASEAARGPVSAIVPAARADELGALLREHGRAAWRRRAVVPRLGESPGHVLLAAEKGVAAVVEEPPLVVHGDLGRRFTDEVAAMVDGPVSIA